MKHIYMLLGPWKDIPGDDEPHLRVVHPGKKRAPPGPQSQQVMLVTPDHKGKAQQKQRKRFLLPSLGNLCLLLILPALPACAAAHTSICRAHPAERTCLVGPRAARPGHGRGGSALSWPNSKGPASNQDFSPPATASPWIKKMVPLQMLAVSATSTWLPRGVNMICADTTKLIIVRRKSTGQYSDNQQALTACGEACVSAALDFAAHPGLQAVWVL